VSAPELTFKIEDTAFLDFESRSKVPITHGTYRYACEADAIVLAYAIGKAPARAIGVGDFSEPLHWDDLPSDFLAHHARVMAGDAIWCAWNSGFDKAVWNYSTYRFPELLPHHIIDAMAQATASGMPPDLAGAAEIAGEGLVKDKRGAALIKLFSLVDTDTPGDPVSCPDEWLEFLDYAKRDVDALRAVFLGTRQLSMREWQEYWAMETINERGISIDFNLATAASQLADEDRIRSKIEIAELTGGVVKSIDEVAKLTRWIIQRVPNEGKSILLEREEQYDENGEVEKPAKHALTRSRVERLIAFLAPFDDALHRAVRRVLEIRLYGGSRTPAKFKRMIQQQVDGVLYGQYVFNGASQTGRASSKGIQVHNLSRNTLAHEHAAILTVGSHLGYDALAACNPDPVVRQLSLLIRPTLIPANGRLFVWSDWSQIEARVLPWLAGEDQGALDRLDIFRGVDADPTLPDLYTRTAATLSQVAIEDVSKDIRQRGKVAELALGFGGGVGALRTMAAAYGMHFKDADARDTVDRWRVANKWCVDFWTALEKAVYDALKIPEQEFLVGRLKYTFLPDYFGGSLCCELPSGRCLLYRHIRYDTVDILDDDGNLIDKELQLRFSRGHGRVKLWKGLLCENVVQAVAADCLRGTLVRLEEDGYHTRLHTHDEILVECEESDAADTAMALQGIMRRGFDWSEGLPLMSEETIAYYYSKHKEARCG
jgi:DNA polymerase